MGSRDVQVFKAEAFFASEIREARRKGFELQVGVGRKGVRARLLPLTPSSRAACHAINAGSFEARCEVPPGEDGLDVLRDTIRAVLEHAETALAA